MEVLLLALFQGAAAILQGLTNKTAQNIGTAVADVDAIALSVLQAVAEVKGITVDWADPAAVGNFVQTLAPFTPIPDPAASAPPEAT